MHSFLKLPFLSAGMLLSVTAVAGITTGIDESAKLPFWEWNDQSVSLRLVQRLPEQSIGFFMARKFSMENAVLIANNCMFQTVFKNISEASMPVLVEYNLNEWNIIFDGKTQKPKTRENWLEVWKNKNIDPSSKIAFEWALMPTIQKYQQGDYNWGMTSFGLPPGTVFNLQGKILVNNEIVIINIPSIQCAPDIHMEPEI